jgi:hypothetical protein
MTHETNSDLFVTYEQMLHTLGSLSRLHPTVRVVSNIVADNYDYIKRYSVSAYDAITFLRTIEGQD